MTIVFAVLVLLAIGAAVASAALRSRSQHSLDWTPSYAPVAHAFPPASGTVDVTVLRIGIDARASKFVRSELEAIAKTYAADDAETRTRKLREVSVMLRRVRDSWIYGGADNEPLRSRDEAIATFARHVDQARTRVRTAPAPDVAASGALPVSLILVSVIVAARGELMTVTEAATGEDLRRALEAATHRAADEILAVEVLWQPPGDGEHVSSLELEAVYSRAELHQLAGVTAGKVFCTYCNGPFPAELVSCPHCGGRAPGREQRA